MSCTDKILFYLPDFYYKYNLHMVILQMKKNYPDWFRDFEIGAVYGSFPGMIWNGGRFVPGSANVNNIEATIKAFNDVGIPVRFTLTNSLVEHKHVYDTYCNLIMQCANNGMNEILVNSTILEDYLRNEYPDFKYILSTTRCERDVNKINEACDKYHLVVTDFRDNHNHDFLDAIKHKNKVELLVDEYCNPQCSLREQHYQYHSKCQLGFVKENMFVCPYNAQYLNRQLENPTMIKPDELYEKYATMGFRNFKIVGRDVSMLDVIESYARYFAKHEFVDEVRYQLVKKMWI